jgi:protein N-lysine methyltransferase METTL21D
MLRRLAIATALSVLLGGDAWPGSATATSPRPRRRRHSRPADPPPAMDDGAAAAGLSDEIDIDAPDAPPGVLALPGRKFPLDFAGGGFTIRGKPVVVREVYNSGQGTGLTIWDGAVVLAKYLERLAGEEEEGGGSTSSASVAGKTVLELGAGTGVVGLAAAAAGASTVYLTDLAYALNNTAESVRANAGVLAGAAVHTAELDWTRPALPPGLTHVDLIVAADVVWVTELIAPLVRTLAVLCRGGGGRRGGEKGTALPAHAPPPPTTVLLAHQTRSRAGDELLFRLLAASGFAAAEVPRAQHHHDFRDDAIAIWRLTWVGGRGERRDGADAEG